jgi:hypothetical protein
VTWLDPFLVRIVTGDNVVRERILMMFAWQQKTQSLITAKTPHVNTAENA